MTTHAGKSEEKRKKEKKSKLVDFVFSLSRNLQLFILYIYISRRLAEGFFADIDRGGILHPH